MICFNLAHLTLHPRRHLPHLISVPGRSIELGQHDILDDIGYLPDFFRCPAAPDHVDLNERHVD
jgi:hypothetical protein